MSIVFIGCVEIGFEALRHLVREGFPVSGVVGLPPERAAAAAGYVDLSPFCNAHCIPLHLSGDVNEPATVEWIRRRHPEIIVVCGWQRLLGPRLLALAPRGCLGFHSSLLPAYRGRAPVNWAIINGEKRTGVTMFMLDEKADAGPIAGQEAFDIHPLETCGHVYAKSAIGVQKLLSRRLPELLSGTATLTTNPSAEHPLMPKRTPADGKVDWTRTALAVHDFVRALGRPYPGAFTEISGDIYFIWRGVPLHPGLVLGLAPGEREVAPGLGLVFGCGDGGAFLVTSGMFEGGRETRPDTDPHLNPGDEP